MSDYKNPRPSATTSAASPDALYDNAVTFNKLLNEYDNQTTYKGRDLISWQKAIELFGFGVASFDFATGGTLDSKNQLIRHSDELLYRYVGSGSFPLIVAPSTNPVGNPDWESFMSTVHNLLSGRDSVGAHDQIYPRKTTLSEIASGAFVLGDRLNPVSRPGAEYLHYGAGTPNGFDIIDAGSGNVAFWVREGETINLEKLGAENGSDITSVLTRALQILDTMTTFGGARGTVSIPAGWSVTVTGQITVPQGCTVFWKGSTITQTQTGVNTFYTNSGFAPIGVSLIGGALHGPDANATARDTSGSVGIKVEGGLPFTRVDIDELKWFQFGGYIVDSYSSRIKFGRIWGNKFNWQFQNQCHASIIDCSINEFADDTGLKINDGTATSFVHAIDIYGAYQRSPKGIQAIKCYEVWHKGPGYFEDNTVFDVQFGSADGGLYQFAAYNCGVESFKTSSKPVTGFDDRGNIVLQHAVGIHIGPVSLTDGASAPTVTNLNYDGFSSNIEWEQDVGDEPVIRLVGGSASLDKLRMTFKGSRRWYRNDNRDQYIFDDERIGRKFTASNTSGRGTLVETFTRGAASSADRFINADSRTIFAGRDVTSWEDAPRGITIDHTNSRIDFGYPAYTDTSNLITSDPREKNSIEVCSLGADFCRALIDEGGVIQYKLNNGGSGRTHYGVRTDILKEVGLRFVPSTTELGMFAEFDQIDKDTGEPTGEKREAARYEQLIAPLMMYVRSLEKRIELLEVK